MSVIVRLALLSICLVLGAQPASAQIARFNPGTGLVEIPSVLVGGNVYTGIQLRNINGQFVLQAAALESPAVTAPFAQYDGTTAVLTIPLVNIVGGMNYSNVTLRNVGNFTFELLGATLVPAPGVVAAPPRWVEAWTSTNAHTQTGTYTLSVINPDSTTPQLQQLDNAISVVDFDKGAARVHGGSYDPVSGQVMDPGVRFLSFMRGGKLYGVNLDRTSNFPPAVVQMTTETGATTPPVLRAQSATGDDAIFQYTVGTAARYMRKSATSTTAPLQAPTFPGEATMAIVGSIVDHETGNLTGLLWAGLNITNFKHRLFRTGVDFSLPQTIEIFDGFINPVQVTNSHARMENGWPFTTGNVLRRYDYETGQITVMHDNVSMIGTPLFDDDSLWIRTLQGGVPTLMRCPDELNAQCVTVQSGAAVGTAGTLMRQTRTHVLITSGAAPITSIRKADGAVSTLQLPTDNVTRNWSVLTDQTAGDRVLYVLFTGTRNLIGSTKSDGTDRKEFDGTIVAGVWTLPPRVEAHRLGYLEHMTPPEKVLVRAGVAGNPLTNDMDRLAWFDTNTGELTSDLGLVPAKFFHPFTSFGYMKPYPLTHANVSVIGLLSDVIVPQQPAVKKLDALRISVDPPDILRLSENVP